MLLDRRHFLLGSSALGAAGLADARAFARGAQGYFVLPSETDSQIRNFDVAHAIYPPRGPARNRLVVFIPGTGRNPPVASRFTDEATGLGFHVVQIAYNHAIPAFACADDPDPDAFAKFRWAIIEGGRSPHLPAPIAPSEGIQNRLVKLLLYLANRYEKQGWGSYLVQGRVSWSSVVLAGHSQGAGHAALLATRYPVGRLLCFGGPKDYSRVLRRPPHWYEAAATRSGHMFAFNNTHDRVGCTFPELLDNLATLGISRVAGMADVDRLPAPYAGAHALFTSWPGPQAAVRPMRAHMSVIADGIGAVPLFAPVWRYMLDAPVG